MPVVRAQLLGGFLFVAIMVLALSEKGAAANRATQAARGKYLVEQVAKCGDCHSPHNAMGQVPAGKELSGATLNFAPIHPVPGWWTVSPPIAGLPTVTTNQAIRLLTMGIASNGKAPRPPMPEYHMSRTDATAIIVYLKSLKPEAK